jgi:hypothetical protein
MKRSFALLLALSLMAVPMAAAQGRDRAPDSRSGFAIPAGPMAQGQSWGNQFSPDQARDARREGRTVPLSRIFDDLRRRHGGYQLGAELYSRGEGRSVYEIDWMTGDGRQMRFTVDAQTGSILNSRGG